MYLQILLLVFWWCQSRWRNNTNTRVFIFMDLIFSHTYLQQATRDVGPACVLKCPASPLSHHTLSLTHTPHTLTLVLAVESVSSDLVNSSPARHHMLRLESAESQPQRLGLFVIWCATHIQHWIIESLSSRPLAPPSSDIISHVCKHAIIHSKPVCSWRLPAGGHRHAANVLRLDANLLGSAWELGRSYFSIKSQPGLKISDK